MPEIQTAGPGTVPSPGTGNAVTVRPVTGPMKDSCTGFYRRREFEILTEDWDPGLGPDGPVTAVIAVRQQPGESLAVVAPAAAITPYELADLYMANVFTPDTVRAVYAAFTSWLRRYRPVAVTCRIDAFISDAAQPVSQGVTSQYGVLGETAVSTAPDALRIPAEEVCSGQ